MFGYHKKENLGRLMFAVLFSSAILFSSVRSCLAAAVTIIWQRKPAEAVDFSRLRNFDLVVVIDKSRSMSVADCQDALQSNDSLISRWEWCHQQTTTLTEATRGVLNDGFTLVVFSGDSVEYSNVGPNAIETVFRENKPRGPTHATRTLNAQFEAYFSRRSRLGGEAKPLLILMITDGCPEDPPSLCTSILKATRRMNHAGEIALTVLQIGHDQSAAKLLNKLNDPVMTGGAKFGIVTTKSFAELQKTGLTGALRDAIATKQGAVPDRSLAK
jgi:hypothetical protein